LIETISPHQILVRQGAAIERNSENGLKTKATEQEEFTGKVKWIVAVGTKGKTILSRDERLPAESGKRREADSDVRSLLIS
jgi:hypothetical protein